MTLKNINMAKDFAFLFYTNDWAGGTQWMTRLQRGGYLDLLLYQVNNTCFTLENAKTVLGEDFDLVWPAVKSKFECENGKYYSYKMRETLAKRLKFTESRRNNRKSKTKTQDKQVLNTSESSVLLKGNENENESLGSNNYLISIYNEKFNKKLSEILNNEYSDVLDIALSNTGKSHLRDLVLKEADIQYGTYDFKDRNHLTKAVNKIVDSLGTKNNKKMVW